MRRFARRVGEFAHSVVELIWLIPFNPMATLWDDDKKRHQRQQDKRR